MSASLFCKVIGAVFVAVAIWGFVDGEKVLIFHVNTAHNVVHLLSGVLALASGFAGENPSRLFSLLFGAVYGLVAILGFAGVDFAVTSLHLNDADNWLHALLAVGFLAVGATSAAGKRGSLGPPPATPPRVA